MLAALGRFAGDESALTTVEYALLLCLIVAAGVATWWATLGGTIKGCFEKSDAEMRAAGL